MTEGLAGIRVVELADQIAGPYCGKLLVDGGADVVKIEQSGGDSLRRTSDALFAYLNAGKRSVAGEIGDAHVDALAPVQQGTALPCFATPCHRRDPLRVRLSRCGALSGRRQCRLCGFH